MAVIEKKLPPLDPTKPKSSGFDPAIFDQVKSGAIIKDPEPSIDTSKKSDLPKEPAPAFEEPIPIVKVIKDPEEVKGPELTKKQLEARRIVDAMEAEQKLKDEEKIKAKQEAEAKKLAEKEEGEEGLLQKEEEDDTSDQPPTLGPLQIKKKSFQKALTEEEELAKFDEESLPFAKKMDRSARQWVLSQLAKKDKAIEAAKKGGTNGSSANGQLPDSYYLHDKAYMLDPQYEQSIGVLQQANAELNYWQQQFAAVRGGEKEWTDIVRKQDGQLAEVKRESNAASEAELIRRINQADTLVNQHRGMLNYLQTQYKTKVSAAMDAVRKVEDEFFPQFSEEDNLKGHKYYEPIQALLNQKGMSSLVPSSLFQKLFLHSQDQQEYIAELEKIAEKKQAEREVAEVEVDGGEVDNTPPKPQIASRAFKGGETGKSKNVDKGFDPTAFEKLKRARGY